MPTFPSQYVGSAAFAESTYGSLYILGEAQQFAFFVVFSLPPSWWPSPLFPSPTWVFYSLSSIQSSPLFPMSLFSFFSFLPEQSNLFLFFNVLLPETPRDSTKRHSNLFVKTKKHHQQVSVEINKASLGAKGDGGGESPFWKKILSNY